MRVFPVFVLLLAWFVPALHAQTTQPLVAVHDSELTRAFETQAASNGAPSGVGTTGNQWWPTNWHYFVMPEAVEQALSSDGTAFTVVGDANIISGTLLTNGVPKYPILISLASEAISDSEIAPLTNYVAAGGYLLVGSSSFTRMTNGTTRGDFAFANALGMHMVNSSLSNWGINTSFTKQFNHRIVSHIPAGVLYWALPNSADETFWGSTSPHTGSEPPVSHPVWQAQAGDATVVAMGDNYPFLMIKPYGKGYFIYIAAMQPITGHSGWAPGMYSYMVFRKAIEWAFESAKVPVPKLSPWPYSYDSAILVRHDLEDYADEIAHVLDSAQFEAAHGLKGDYYFCTGTLRVDMPTNGYTLATNVANLNSAVANYGATIGPHNGGLQNPNYFSAPETNFDYWHWGSDEVLSLTNKITNNAIVYSNGTAYALASVSNAFGDIEGWLTNNESSAMRSWAAPYFNSTREGSVAIEAQLGVKTTGDLKNSPFPSWIFSTGTSGLTYPILNVPVSDWYVNPGPITYVSHSLEAGHNLQTMQALVDFYYNSGLLINLYSHTLSASSSPNGPGPSGSLEANYVFYASNTNLHPRAWAAGTTNLYNWWIQRSNVLITANTSNGPAGLSTTTFLISGSTNTNTSVELYLPAAASISGLQVQTNGVAALAGTFRTTGQTLKILVGTSVTNAVVSYTAGPLAVADTYSTPSGTQLTVAAPGVLGNDGSGLGTGSLTAVLTAGVTNGTLGLNADGSFTYTPAANYVGNDSFTYQVNNGVSTSSPATVTITVMPSGTYVSDNFSRSAGADPLAPWQVPTGFGSWGITNGTMQGTSPGNSYGFIYISNNWTDFSVQAQVQFPANAFGGGIGGRLNPTTGTHYVAWVYPGTTNVQLLKFTSWGTFSVLANAALGSAVGTNIHTVQMTFQGSQISVYYDGSQMINVSDNSGPYLSGGLIADMWTAGTPYVYTLDNVTLSPSAVPPIANNDTYSLTQGGTLSVSSPGVLANDGGGSGPLTAQLIGGVQHGALNLNANGGFTYTPTASFFGADSFTYQANDGHTNSAPATVTINVSQAPLPVANSDNYSFTPGVALVVPASGVLGNDTSPNGSNLVASVVSGPAHGSLTLNANGSFNYTPSAGFHGNDSFSYQAFDGLNNSAPGVVTLNDGTAGILFADNFLRSSDPGSVSPWVVRSNNWTVTGATLQGGTDSDSTYGTVYLTNNWTNYFVQASVRFSTTSAYGGAIGGCVNTNTGARYEVWVYPEGSVSGGPALKLVKFSNWNTWGYNGTPLAAIQTVALSSVGTDWHTVKLAFNAGRIAAYFDGVQVISTVDADTATPPYTNGGASVDMWTHPSSYVMSVSNFVASTLVADDAYTVNGSGPLTVSFPGVLGNDTEVYGASLSASLVSTPTNGTLSLNPNGAFTYTPTNSASYDSFGYQAIDGGTNLGTATVSITHIALSQTITFGPLAGQTYGNAPFGVSATASSGLPVSFSILSGPATIAGTNVTITGAGTVTVRASQAGNASYGAAPNVDQPFVVSPAPLAVTANSTNRLYGQTNPVFTATYTGFVNGETNNVLGGNPSLTTTATTNSGTGSYTITAGQGGMTSANYSFSFTNGTLTVGTVVLGVTANNKNRSYGQTNPVFTATYTGFVNGQTNTVLGGSPSLTTPATTNSGTGSYTITAGQGGMTSTNYTFVFTNGTLTVGTVALGVTANNKNRSYGQTNPVFTATYTGFVNGETNTVLGGSPSLTTTATTNSGTGSYTITAGQGGMTSTNYTFTFTNGTLTVGTVALGVTANNKNRLYGQTNPVFTATYTGFVNGETNTVLGGNPSLTTTATTNSSAGAYTITAGQGGMTSTNYTFTFTNGTLTVGTVALGVTANSASRLYGQTNPVFMATYTGFVNGETNNVLGGSPSLTTTATTNSGTGSYTITAGQGGMSSANYTFSFTNGTLSVGAVTLGVTADNKARPYGATNPVFTATYTGFVNGETNNVLGGSPSLITTADTNSPLGQYTIAAGQGTMSSTNYNFSFTNGTLTVGSVVLGVTANATNRLYGQTNPVFTVTYTGFVNGDTSAVLGGSPSLTTTATTNSGTGNYMITVGQGAMTSTNYTFNFTNGSLAVNPTVLGVTANPTNRLYGQTNPVFTVTYTGFVNGETNTVLGDVPSLTTTATTNSGVGNYTITAGQGEMTSTNYTFSFTNGTLTVGAVTLGVTANSANRLYGQTNPVFTATYTGFVNGETNNVLGGSPSLTTTADTNSGVGSYTITAAPGAMTSTNYTFSFTNGTLTVGTVTLGVTANSTSRLYGQTNPVFTATYTGFVNGETNNVLGGSPSLTTTADTNSGVGSYTITAAQGGLTSTNYAFTFTNGTLTVGSVVLGVTANPTNRLYGQTNPVFTVTYTGFVNGDTVGVLGGSPSLTTTADTNSGVGSYTITAGQGAMTSTNYTFSFTNGTLTVGQALLTVSADNFSRSFGATNPVFTATYTGFVNAETTNVLGGSPSLTTTADMNSPAGAYTITATNGTLSSTNYAFTFVNGVLTINSTAPITVSITNSGASGLLISWTATSNTVYRVQYNSDLLTTNWLSLTPDVTATNSTASLIDNPQAVSQRFYRVIIP